jgi:hypothetical protein
VLVDLLSQLFFYKFECFMLRIALSDESSLFLHENRSWMCDLYYPAEARIESRALREVLDFWILPVKLGK